MAYQEITGGDGATGQTGEQVKDIINENFVELYEAVEEVFSRAFTETLLFDKPEIYYAPHVQDDDINFTLAGSGHMVNNSSGARMTISFDGEHPIYLSSDFNEIIGFESGDIIPAGTRKVYFLYVNGEVTINIPGVSSQPSGITKLSTPGSFAVVADGENALDMTWTDVSDEVGYQIERSLNGTSGWVLYSNPAADATSDTETGLDPGDIIYYRIKAIGDGTIFSDSNYAYANGQTENTGDTTPPSFTFDPVNGVSTWTVNRPIIVTASEPIRTDSGTELTSANAGTYFNVKETNSGGATIPGTWSVNSAKTVFTFTPTTTYGASQVVYVAVLDVEDNDGNEIAGPISITFTTTDYTYFNGTTNRLQFGDLGDSVWAVADINFWLEITIKNHVLTGTRVLWGKSDLPSNQRSWFFFTQDTDIYFNYYGNGVGSAVRSIKWTGALTTGEQTLVLKYNGALDTNDGLDRAVLEKDGVVVGSKSVAVSGGVLTTILLSIYNSSAYLSVGNLINSSGVPGSAYWFSGEAKDLFVRTVNGTNVWLSVPIIAVGTDTSGNGRSGTWVG